MATAHGDRYGELVQESRKLLQAILQIDPYSPLSENRTPALDSAYKGAS